MQRLVLAVLFVAVAGTLIFVAVKGLAGVARGAHDLPAKMSGDGMPKIAFFLLLCVMVYAISTGAR